jgi:hypothetical protein
MSMWLSALIGVVALVGLVVALVVVVRRDGLGHRPPPASHPTSFEAEPLT